MARSLKLNQEKIDEYTKNLKKSNEKQEKTAIFHSGSILLGTETTYIELFLSCIWLILSTNVDVIVILQKISHRRN